MSFSHESDQIDPGAVKATLDWRGAEGWELVTVVPTPKKPNVQSTSDGTIMLFWKRPATAKGYSASLV